MFLTKPMPCGWVLLLYKYNNKIYRVIYIVESN